METRSGRIYSRRFHHPVEHLSSTLDQPSVESTHQVSTENSPRTSTTGNNCSSHWPSHIFFPLLQQLAVQPPIYFRRRHIKTTHKLTPHPLQPKNWKLSVRNINKKFGTLFQLTIASKEFLSSTLTTDTSTNKACIKAQREFDKWSLSFGVDITNYNAFDLVDFLQHVHSSFHFQLNTLKLWRSAVARFHHSPSALSGSHVIASFLSGKSCNRSTRGYTGLN